jgi:co-chaperonin GroES (HSP10)
METGIGDKLARGFKTAQFAAGGSDLSDFEYDLRTRKEIVADKYGLSEAEIAAYEARLDAGEHIALASVETQKELGLDLVVVDRRPTFMGQDTEVKAAPLPELKYPEKTYGEFRPILDRILIKRCAENKNMELLEDGSIKNKKTGLITAAKYRQHSNVGVVLATGRFVILGGQRIDMGEVVRVGDRVTYGDYNSEILIMSKERVIALCDAISFNYFDDDAGLRVVRVQDVRGVEHEVPSTTYEMELEKFKENYGGNTSAPGVPVKAEFKTEGLPLLPITPKEPVVVFVTDQDGTGWRLNEAAGQWESEGGHQCKAQS